MIDDDDRVDDDDDRCWIGVNEDTTRTCTPIVATNANEIKATTFIDILLLFVFCLFIVNIMVSFVLLFCVLAASKVIGNNIMSSSSL